MRLYFTLTSPLIELPASSNPFVYQLAVADEALLLADDWHQVLRVDRIGERLLRRLIAEHIRGIRPRNYADQLAVSFDGGLRIESAAGTLDFQCCGDLGDAAGWERLLREPPAEWRQVWIGHPWIYARFDAEHVYLSDYCETGGPVPDNPPPVRLTLNRNAFVEGLRAAIAGLHDFFHRLRRVISAHVALENKPALLAALTADYFPVLKQE